MKEHGKKLNKRALAFFVVNTKNDLPGCGLLSSGRRSSQCQTSEYCRFVDSGLPEFRYSVALLCLVSITFLAPLHLGFGIHRGRVDPGVESVADILRSGGRYRHDIGASHSLK